MRKLFGPLLVLSLMLISCSMLGSSTTPVVIVVTATPPPAAPTTVQPTFPPSLPTSPPAPVIPTTAPLPVATRTTTPKLVTISQFESALLKDGYIRRPYSSIVRPGIEGASWDKENVWEVIYTYTDGYVRMEILHAPSQTTRTQHMETKLVTLDSIFPADFMKALRQANDTYNKSNPSIATGNCPHSWSYNDEWSTKEAQCNVSSSTIGGYPVTFALWYYQVTCPPQYDYCYFPSFPGQEFYGQTGMTFYTIEIDLAH